MDGAVNYSLFGEMDTTFFFKVYSAVKNSPITGLGSPRGFQEVKVIRFSDNGAGWW